MVKSDASAISSKDASPKFVLVFLKVSGESGLRRTKDDVELNFGHSEFNLEIVSSRSVFEKWVSVIRITQLK